jgi:membrane-associated phospholipid phosphatase
MEPLRRFAGAGHHRRPAGLRIVLALALTLLPLTATADGLKDAIKDAAKTTVDDATTLATAPIKWKAPEWRRFAEGAGTVAAVMVADKKLEDIFQRNRGSATNWFARNVTSFGGGRAEQVSAVLIGTGWLLHNDGIFGAGRDSLEAEIWAGGIVTPIIKDIAGRARPNTNEGTWKFHPFSTDNPHNSFPSGHATNAFAAATAIAAHSNGWIVPTIVYTLATGVAFSRVNDRAHFPSDVVAGALIGRAVARGLVAHHMRVHVAPVIAPKATGVILSMSWGAPRT